MHNERIGKPKVSEYLHSGFKVYSLLYEQTVGLMERCQKQQQTNEALHGSFESVDSRWHKLHNVHCKSIAVGGFMPFL